MSPDITLRTRDSIASLLSELSFDDSTASSPATDETTAENQVELKAETPAETAVDDFAEMEVVPLTASEMSPSIAVQKSVSVNVNYQARPAARPWKMFLDGLAGKPPVLVETKETEVAETAVSEKRATKPAMWKWSQFLDTLAGRAEVQVIEEKLPAAIRWQSLAARSPGLTISELITQIDA